VTGVLAGYVGPVRGYLSQRAELRQEQARLRQLEAQRDRLARRLTALDDPVVLEVVAREKNLVRPGERVFFIRPPAPRNGGAGDGTGAGD
jgi:cell division protein FtsB